MTGAGNWAAPSWQVDVANVRDTAVLLSGEPPYREFPLAWYLRHLRQAGYQVSFAPPTTNLY